LRTVQRSLSGQVCCYDLGKYATTTSCNTDDTRPSRALGNAMSEKKKTAGKLVRGKVLRTHLENIIASEREVDAATRERLASRFALFITSARFRAMPPAVTVTEEQPAAQTAVTRADATKAIVAGLSGQEIERPGPAAPFDPYAFSAEALILRNDEPTLRRELNEVADAGHLKQLAKAQKLSLPRELRTGDAASLGELRDAIIDAAKKRVANRQAAAG